MTLALGDRLACTDPPTGGDRTPSIHFATVRFKGEIAAWPGEEALGVEWDHAGRGKSDGSLNGVRYFHASSATAASFIRQSSRKICARVSFGEALDATYRAADEERPTAIRFGTKVVETLGFGRLSLMQAHHETLCTVSLPKKGIYRLGEVFLPHLESLDLSYNLLTNLNEVFQALASLHHLKTLNVNGNVFQDPVLPMAPTTVERLYLSDTRATVAQINAVLKSQPGLRHLALSSNHLENSQVELMGFGKSRLDSLSLSYNRLSHVDFAALPSSLTILDLSGNALTRLGFEIDISPVEGGKSPAPKFNASARGLGAVSTLTALDLRSNHISLWSEVDALRTHFPRLESLRLSDNPLSRSLDTYHLHLCGRLGALNGTLSVDGARVSALEMENAEFWLVSQLRQGLVDPLPAGPRHDLLTARFGPLHVARPAPTLHMESEFLRVAVRLPAGAGAAPRTIRRTMFRSQTVLRLKGWVGLETGLLVLAFGLSYELRLTDPQNQTLVKRIELDELFKPLGNWGLPPSPCLIMTVYL